MQESLLRLRPLIVLCLAIQLSNTCQGQLFEASQTASFNYSLLAHETVDNSNIRRLINAEQSDYSGFNLDVNIDERLDAVANTYGRNGGEFFINGHATATVKASGFIKTDNFAIKMDAIAEVAVNGTAEAVLTHTQSGLLGVMTSEISATDSFILQSQGAGTFPSIWTSGYVLKWRYDAGFSNTAGVRDSFIGINLQGEFLQFDNAIGSGTIGGFVNAHVSSSNNQGSRISQAASVGVAVGFDGQNPLERGLIDLGNTIELESITFMDGTTPESHGLDLVFASGRTSPNLYHVPEPGAFILLCLAGPSLACGRVLRPRGRRPGHPMALV